MNYEERTTPRVELPLHEEEYKINMAGIDSRMADVLKQMEKEERRRFAVKILRRAIRYVEGYLKDFIVETKADFKSEDPWIKIVVRMSEE